jgi:glycosyltransferase involved in cell wall biosynthesis
MNKKLIRITTVPMALRYLLPGQMHFMQQNGFDVLMISSDGKELADVIANEECRHIIVPMTRRITPIQDLKCLIQLIKIFKKEKPAIVHTHTPKAGLLGMMAAKYCGVKIRVHTVAGLPLMVEKGFKALLLKFIEKITYSAATQVWPNSFSLLQIIKDKKLTTEKKLKVIGKGSSNGIDTVRFDIRNLPEVHSHEIENSFHFSPSNKYLLCVGRLVADKGIPELVKVFCSLQTKIANLKLILVGQFEKELDPLPAGTISEIDENESIIHVDWTEEVEYYLAISDYFVFPSHREGFPNVLLQAGAMNLPIICSNIEGNVDIVKEKITGLLFEKANEQQLMQQIEFALDNPEAMKQMAKNLCEIIQADYHREHIWKSILDEYQKLLN